MRSGYARTFAAAAIAAGLVGLGCGAPAPHRDPPVGSEPPHARTTPDVVDTFSSRADLPPAPRESLLVPPPRSAARRSSRAAARDSAPPSRRRRSCLVERVHDGDTIRCRGGVSVRLLLIDAPELSQRPFGDQARRALTRLVPVGAQVTLETDVEPRDRYGRLLAYVYRADGRMVNEEMAREGYATVLVYAPNGRYRTRVDAAAADAARARRGLYATDGFACAPREHRRKRC